MQPHLLPFIRNGAIEDIATQIPETKLIIRKACNLTSIHFFPHFFPLWTGQSSWDSQLLEVAKTTKLFGDGAKKILGLQRTASTIKTSFLNPNLENKKLNQRKQNDGSQDYMLTTWHTELSLKEQSQSTFLSTLFSP